MEAQKIWAVLIDTVSIQEYIFASNKLKENLGASFLVQEIYRSKLRRTVCDVLDDLFDHWREHPQEFLLLRNQPFEVGHIGGGNALLLFREKDRTEEFIQEWTTRLLVESPGITTAIACQETTLDELKDNFKDIKKALDLLLMKNRRIYIPQTILSRHGITAECPRSGFSAEVEIPQDNEYIPISSVTNAKLEAVPWAREQLQEEFGEILGDQYTFTDEITELGQRPGEDSHIAIVHIDGNDMSEQLQRIDSLEAFRRFSKDVEEGTKGAFKTLLRHIVAKYDAIMQSLGWEPKSTEDVLRYPWGDFNITARSLSELQKTNMPAHILSLLEVLKGQACATFGILKQAIGGKLTKQQISQIIQHAGKKKILPIRYIILGGDDITFVCDGRLGIYFAKLFIEFFEKKQREQDLNLTACAGIAVTKTKYPFYRGYQIADDLCSYAKKVRKAHNDSASYFDFHISFGGIFESLEDIQKKYFQATQGNLLCRPFRLVSQDNRDGRNFDTFLKYVNELREFPNNKRQELRQVLTLSEAATRQFVQEMKYRDRIFLKVEGGEYHKTLFDKDKKVTPYFDMIEILELYPEFALQETRGIEE